MASGSSAWMPPDIVAPEGDQHADASVDASADGLAAVYADVEGRTGTTIEDRELSLGFVAAGQRGAARRRRAAFDWTGRFRATLPGAVRPRGGTSFGGAGHG